MPKVEEEGMDYETQVETEPIDYFDGFNVADLVIVKNPTQKVTGILKNMKGVKKDDNGQYTGYVLTVTDASTNVPNQNGEMPKGSMLAVYLTRSQGLNLQRVINLFVDKKVTITGGVSIKSKVKGRKETNTIRISDGDVAYGSDFILRNNDGLHVVGIMFKDFETVTINNNISYTTPILVLKMDMEGKTVLPYNTATGKYEEIFNGAKYNVLQWFVPTTFYKKVIQSPLYTQGTMKPILFDIQMNIVTTEDNKKYYSLKGLMKWVDNVKEGEYDLPPIKL